MTKRRKATLAILVLALIFCLWYTRPRSFEDLAGEGNITSISVIAQIPGIETGEPYINVWTVDSQEDRDYVNSGIEDILKSCKYRVSLRSLFPFPSVYDIPGKGEILINIAAVMDDGSFFTGNYKGATATLDFDKRMVIQASDKSISEKLLAFAQEFGWKI
ncbi:MAG: hypothetical protein HDT14_12730 [Oscillibacter sp.]|nr:hypothetical protein [Oscillibacter sp.]